MTWEESDRLTWDEREVLLNMADKRSERAQSTPPAAAHVPAVERLTARAGL